MLSSRRFLPAIHLLNAFESVARHASITRAAEELNLTQGAVSRQIISLEDQLGVKLFDRHLKRLYLTELGSRYLTDIRQALDMISNATFSIRANPDGGHLNLGILPTFGTYWLAPKLPAFFSANPGVSINLFTRIKSFSFDHDALDAAIFYGDGQWENTNVLKLWDEILIPACAPEFLDKYNFQSPDELLKAPMLSLATRPDAWRHWFAHHAIDEAPPMGMIFDQFATLAQAAKHGLGIALLPSFFIKDEIRNGGLVSAYGPPVDVAGGYYLVWPKKRECYPPIKRLAKWLSANLDEGTR